MGLWGCGAVGLSLLRFLIQLLLTNRCYLGGRAGPRRLSSGCFSRPQTRRKRLRSTNLGLGSQGSSGWSRCHLRARDMGQTKAVVESRSNSSLRATPRTASMPMNRPKVALIIVFVPIPPAGESHEVANPAVAAAAVLA